MKKFTIVLPILAMLIALIFGTVSVIMLLNGVYIKLNIIAIMCHTISFIFNSTEIQSYGLRS